VTAFAGRSRPLPGVDAPPPAIAGTILGALAAQDFGRLASAFTDDAHLRALLPGGLREWEGVGAIEATFARWFGNTTGFELVAADVDQIGSRLRLRWRVRLQADRLGPGWFLVEQEAYADTDDEDRIHHISLLCSGYCTEEQSHGCGA
jgi:hypothetical protein